MKYKVDLTIHGSLDIEADSKEEAKAKIEEGYSLKDFNFEDDEIDEITLIKEEVKP